MVSTTMNGWSLVDVPLAKITAGGLSTQIRAGDVATVLEHVGRRFHAEVEALITFHGFRTVEVNKKVGGHPRSNHPSGTAFDANGAKHPYKEPVNFTAAQVAAIRAILAEVAPVIRWGGDFPAAFRDGMHFEVVGTPEQVAAVAARINAATGSRAMRAMAIEPVLPDPFQEDDMIPLISWCYTALVGRPGTDPEIDGWLVTATTNKWTPDQIRAAFLGARAEPATVVKAYADFLHRAPSQADIDERIGNQLSIGKVRADVAGSEEAGKLGAPGGA